MRRSVLCSLFVILLLCISAGCLLLGCGPEGPHAEIKVRNFILFIGDGMGVEHLKAASLYKSGKTDALFIKDLPFSALMTTSASGGALADSASSATAMATGVKVGRGVLSMKIPGDRRKLTTVLEYFRAEGRSAGLVTTTYITHATPAAFGAHEPGRRNHLGVLFDYIFSSRPEVLFGGAKYVNGLIAKLAGYRVVYDRTGLSHLDTESVRRVWGQFYRGNMPYVNERPESVPGLAEMTEAALKILDNDPDGFFLMVEGGRIDHAAHDNDIERVIGEVIEFSEAVERAVRWASGRKDTLIVVTADHETGGLRVLGSRGKGTLPEVSWSEDYHTDAPVPVYAVGPGAQSVSGLMDNTDIFRLTVGRVQR